MGIIQPPVNASALAIAEASMPLPAPQFRLTADYGITSSSGVISAWNAIAGAVSATQATGGVQPTLAQTAYGPAVRCTGVEWMNLTGATYSNDMTVIVAFKGNSYVGRQTLLGHENTSNGFQLELNPSAPELVTAGARTGASVGAIIAGFFSFITPELPFRDSPVVLSMSRRGFASAANFGVNSLDSVGLIRSDTTNSFAGNGSKTLFRRAASSQMFNGDLYEVRVYSPSLTPTQERAARRQMMVKWNILDRRATTNLMWAGALTDTSFRVNADVLLKTSSVALVVSTTPNLNTPVYVSPYQTPKVVPGTVDTYQTVAFDVAGLQPNTTYYYGLRFVENPDAMDTLQHTIRTAPVKGSPASFTFAFGSCSDLPFISDQTVFASIARDNPLFFMHLGDITYSDIALDNVLKRRDAYSRLYRRNARVDVMHRTVPSVYTISNHDSADPNGHWDAVYTGTTYAKLLQDTRQVYLESVPAYDLVQAPLSQANPAQHILTQTFDVARIRFLLLDTYSQRRRTVGTPTILGHTSGHELFDQLTWLKNALVQAGTDGIKLLFLCNASTWNGNVFDGWDEWFANEQTDLCNYIRDTPGIPAVVLLGGDIHEGAFDDGANTDKSTGGNGRFPQIVSSGLVNSHFWNLAGPYTWNGASKRVQNVVQLYATVTVTDAGGDNVSWSSAIKGDSIDGTTFAPTTLATAASTDVANAVSFVNAAPTVARNGVLAVTLDKSWFGPVGGCSVDWSSSNGQSGTVTFRPNSNRASFNLTAPSTVGSVTITLANAVKCAIGGTNPVTVTVT